VPAQEHSLLRPTQFIEYITSNSSPTDLLFCIDFFFFLFCQPSSSSSIKYKRGRRNLLRRYRLYNSRRIYLFYLFIIIQRRGRSYILNKIGLFRIVHPLNFFNKNIYTALYMCSAQGGGGGEMFIFQLCNSTANSIRVPCQMTAACWVQPSLSQM
jgi:hypothetical protein